MENQEYKITIKTEDEYRIAGTKSKLSIQLVGEKRESEWFALNDKEKQSLQAGSTDVFTVSTQHVGKLNMIRLKLDDGDNDVDDWSAEYIIVTHNGRDHVFPFYEFITTDVVEVVCGKASLPQHETDETLIIQRKKEIDLNRRKYAWNTKPKKGDFAWGLPRMLAEQRLTHIPKEFRPKDVRNDSFKIAEKFSQENVALEMQENANIKLEFDSYKELFSHPNIPKDLLPSIEKSWDTDKEFGRQILNGINPTVLERCNKLPNGCDITNNHVKDLLEGKSLSCTIQCGKMYMVNYFEALKEVKRNIDIAGNQVIAPDCLCLLYASNGGDLLPVAIQLEASNLASIFTPKDEKYDWLLAKMYFRCTDGNYHEWVSHLMNTHISIEPIAIALFRCFPRSHPVYKLLRPHTSTSIPINTYARQTLLHPTGAATKFMSIDGSQSVKKYYTTFAFDDLDVPQVLQRQGLTDNKLLPNFYYRDDVIKLWKIVGWYTERVIKHYYKCNEEIKNDFELQSWISEIAYEGFGWMDGDTKGVPTSFTTVEELVKFCTDVIATSSIQHSAVNFGQLDIYKYIPNAPLGMRKPIHKKGEGSIERVMATLPNVLRSALQIALAYQLSEFSPDEIYLGQFPDKLFVEERIEKIREKFREKLSEHSDSIKERNKDLEVPYEYLLPERIAASVAI